ncbi:unnamed protein product [Rotaria magnacalcarata]|uniref:Uncharacterized protein n=1 Tax=Rotaria magnacalcarata TaxID=392030 RepID=A0A815Z2H3_9BILA|nr:unnamed protein product [Rotaria magnacalcarata]CAF4914333.1 unnamed protein product [Rotaria magnacalcarata]
MELADKLCLHVRHLSSCLTSISIFNPLERTIHSLDAEQTTFMWFQLFVEILLRLKVTSAAQDRMREECCSNYASNQIELHKINEFFDSYTLDKAAHWFTRDSFLYRLLNKAFRTQNIDEVVGVDESLIEEQYPHPHPLYDCFFIESSINHIHL